jgi:hypothetical protein
MGNGKAVKFFTAVCVALALLVAAGTAQAGFNGLPEVIMLKPGLEQTRQFYLNDEFDAYGLNNYGSYLFVAIGDNTTQCGNLTITLSTSATISFGAYIDYSLIGFAYPVGGKFDKKFIINTNFTTPQKATKVITLNSVYGFGWVGALIRSIEGVVTQPTPFSINFKLEAKAKK